MLLGPVWCFTSMSFAQHSVINVLEQMKDRVYQFEVKGITELKVEWPASETAFRTVTIPNHYVVGKSGDYASLFYQVRNPEEEVLISDGKVIVTVDPKRTFQNSACLENRGVLFFPFYLLNEFYDRKVVSEE